MDENLTPEIPSGDAGQVGAEGPQEVTTSEGEAVVAEQPVTEKPQQSREENAQYKALRLAERQSAIDAEYANLAQRYGMTKLDGTPIRTKAEFESTQEAAQQRDALIMQGKTEREATLEVQLQQIQKVNAERDNQTREQERANQEVSDLRSYFEEVNGRRLTQADAEEMKKAGLFDLAISEKIPLKRAYDAIFAKQQRERLKAIDAGKKTQEANLQNASTSTGSVTGGGAADTSVLTDEVIANMSQKEMAKRWPEIKKFYGMR